jgi:hypothetical protein
MRASDKVGPSARPRATSVAVFISSPSSTTSQIRPHSLACSAVILGASMASARARCSPTRRGRNHVLPPSGRRPMRAKACRKLADLAAIAMSAASAKLMPTPAAGPLTAATIGLGTERIRRITGLKNLSSAEPESPPSLPRSGSLKSAPAQKPRPAPVSSTARTEPSAASFSQQSLSSAIILRDTALSLSGAFSVSVARPWSWAMVMVL